MSKHLERDLETLQRNILGMGAAVEEAVYKAIRALQERDIDQARDVIAGDNAIDESENRVEEECLKILALHQPVAVDLRRVAAILAINVDLERMADLAVDIAERAEVLAGPPFIPVPDRLQRMADLTTTMVRQCLDAFVHLNVPEARKVIRLDDEIDRLNVEVIAEIVATMRESADSIEPGLSLFSAVRHLERIADHATNIAEDVVYLVEGEIVHHRPEAVRGVTRHEGQTRMSRPRILIIEDERGLTQALEYNFGKEGYDVAIAHDGAEGLRKAQTLLPEVVILDLMLPGMSGLDVCRHLRAGERTKALPILMLTARAEETDQVVGFTLGADDYVTKPFNTKVLLQRVKVLLRRADSKTEPGEIVGALGIQIDFRHQATAHGKPVELTPTEFRLLECMLRQPGRAFTRHQLMDAAIGTGAIVLERTIDVHVKTLRRKLGGQDLIETVRGVGYRFKEPAAEAG